MVESKGLVPEGYVRFLTEQEEEQYLNQTPPTNILLPPPLDSGEATPRQPTQSWPEDDAEWIDKSEISEPSDPIIVPQVRVSDPNTIASESTKHPPDDGGDWDIVPSMENLNMES